ncbi:MAG TPA: cobalamin B12-binding domain-containing protein [Candidatus Margulisiibacteriota bacterium]|nr:cobalamin B12-binding domain-containing protein [Candidatus Margulisiibacteriota bacterium]
MKTATRRDRGPAHDAYPLRTVVAMTGLTPDLIRAWEKRYGVVAPIRGARGARLYSSADIAHLRLLARVVGAGRAIGDVAPLSPAELQKLAAQGAPEEYEIAARGTGARREELVARILERLERFDYGAVTRLLGDAVVGLGVRSFLHEVVLPLVHRAGTRWADGELSIAEEHLLTGMLRNLLAGLLQGRTVYGRPIVLATAAGERHEIGLLVVALLARDAGANVVYLGVDLPAVDIVTAATRSHARVVGLSVVLSKNRAHATEEVAAIHTALPAQCELWLGGADAGKVAAGVKAFRGLVLETLETTETELARIAAGASHTLGPREGNE